MPAASPTEPPAASGPTAAPLVEPTPTPWGRLVVLGLVVAAILVLVFTSDVSFREVRAWVEDTGVWAPLVYLVLFVVAAVVVTPGTALYVTAALLFPLGLAIFLAWAGGLLAASVCFLLARHLGRGFVERLLGDRLGHLDERAAERGFQVVLTMRLAGLPPFNMLNYAVGLTRIRFRDHVLGTALGTIPLVVAVVTLVARIGGAPTLADVFLDPVLYLALGGVLLVVLVANVLRRRARGLVR